MIYDFTKGVSAIYFASLFKIDYNFEFEEYEIDASKLEEDAIGYYRNNKKNGLVRLGIFLPTYNDVKYSSPPRIHIHNCKTTNILGRKMKSTNASMNTYYSIDNKQDITTRLDICKQCLENLKKDYKIRMGVDNFNEFILALEESKGKQTRTDKNGYILNWRQVSFCYRESKKFCCEKCGFKAKSDSERKFIHTHHVDTNKKNNFRSNFQCLCIKCHSEIDQHHQEMFEMSLDLLEFFNLTNQDK